MSILWILVTLVVITLAWFAFWMLITLISSKSSWQEKFVNGSLPSSTPEGFHRGSAYLLGDRPVPWLGKSFDSANDLGFNIFTPNGAKLLRVMTPLYKAFRINVDGNTEAYNFKTYSSVGFKDKGVDTFKLDYASPENPFLIRIILDEIVETAPDEYLGKVHLKVLPGYYATIGFFGLKKTR